jgi:hypothetical protein
MRCARWRRSGLKGSGQRTANALCATKGIETARISGLAGGRRARGGMRGCVLRHARSIGANESGSNFGTGWAVGWAVCPFTVCKLLKGLVGASGFEPPTSWSRTLESPVLGLFAASCTSLFPWPVLLLIQQLEPDFGVHRFAASCSYSMQQDGKLLARSYREWQPSGLRALCSRPPLLAILHDHPA